MGVNMTPEKSIAELSKTLRKFFANLLDIKYQFTYEELREELRKLKIDRESKKEIETFFKGLVEMQYGGGKIKKEDADMAAKKASLIIQKVSGYAEEEPEPKPKPGRSKIVKKILGGMGRMAGMRDIISKGRAGTFFEGKSGTGNGIMKDTPSESAVIEAGKKAVDKGGIESEAIQYRKLSAPSAKEITENIDAFTGKEVKLKGSMAFVNRIPGTGDFWYMFKDRTGNIVAMSSSTDKYAGTGTLRGTAKKTLSGEPFIRVKSFE